MPNTTLWNRLLNGLRAGVTGFREGMLADTIDDTSFSTLDARQQRYEVFWAFFENSAYRDIHSWAKQFKTDYGLYRYTRGIYNPAYRLGDFWQTHLLGGQLDPAAGDGKEAPSALPIVTEFDNLRPAIAKLWRWSNWQIKKDTLSLWGSVLGDTAIQVVDEFWRGKVYLRAVHPSTLTDVVTDAFGNVKGYTINESRVDPDDETTSALYTETAWRDGDNVVYETKRNDQPFAWNGQTSNWEVPYGFVPLVLIQHNDVGLSWGWSELQPELEKVREADDQASLLNDWVRKNVAAQWMFAGVADPNLNVSAASRLTGRGRPAAATDGNPAPGRQEQQALYAPAGATATALVSHMDLAASLANLKELLTEMERDYPELKVDVLRASGAVTGRAMQLAQQPAENKVKKRRPNYDNALVRAQQMGLSIGGMRGLTDFPFSLASYETGALEHSIGDRPIFETTEGDRLENEKLLWEAASAATAAGSSLEAFLRRQGWTDERIADAVSGSTAAAAAAGGGTAANSAPDIHAMLQPHLDALKAAMGTNGVTPTGG